MSEMVERAARALRDIYDRNFDCAPWDDLGADDRALFLADARAALLAALDPEDEALEEIVNRGLDGVPSGKSAIGAIRDYLIAQGASVE